MKKESLERAVVARNLLLFPISFPISSLISRFTNSLDVSFVFVLSIGRQGHCTPMLKAFRASRELIRLF